MNVVGSFGDVANSRIGSQDESQEAKTQHVAFHDLGVLFVAVLFRPVNCLVNGDFVFRKRERPAAIGRLDSQFRTLAIGGLDIGNVLTHSA